MSSAPRRHGLSTLLLVLVAGLLLGPAGTSWSAASTATAPRAVSGLYVGPGAKNLAGAAKFTAWSGLPITDVVDFPPTGAWTGSNGLSGPSWLLEPYRGSSYRLEYSLPMLPDLSSTNLADCAAGAYDTYWTATATNLLAYGLPGTIVRPGWEMNGNWYRWSAAGKVASYVGCFQRIVTAMRAVPGNRFTFDWTTNLGLGTFAAEQAYPGDAYVDYVGVDVYDLSWSWYPLPAGLDRATAGERAWAWILKGDHGLNFWKTFAAAHGKPMSVPEWGSTIRTDGHGGGDNPVFVDRMLDFLADPANNVAFAHYFNIDAGSVKHDLMREDTSFPLAGARFRERVAAMIGPAPAPVVTPTPTPTRTTPAPTPKPTQTPTPVPVKPAISLTASGTSVGYGSAVTLDATATRTQGKLTTPVPGAKVALQAAAGAGWNAVATGTTDSTGKVRFTPKPTAATTYRVTLTEAGTTVTATRAVAVTHAVSGRLTATTVNRNAQVTLCAEVGRKPAKGTRVIVERLVNGKWSTTAEVLTDATGAAKWRPATRAAGTYTFRVRVLASGGLTSGVTAGLVLRVN